MSSRSASLQRGRVQGQAPLILFSCASDEIVDCMYGPSQPASAYRSAIYTWVRPTPFSGGILRKTR